MRYTSPLPISRSIRKFRSIGNDYVAYFPSKDNGTVPLCVPKRKFNSVNKCLRALSFNSLYKSIWEELLRAECNGLLYYMDNIHTLRVKSLGSHSNLPDFLPLCGQ